MSGNDAAPAAPVAEAPSHRSWSGTLEDFPTQYDSSPDFSVQSSDDDNDTLSSETDEGMHGIRSACDSDEPLSPCWRMHPDESHSDYTIIIQREGGQEDTYHVHKVFLAVGPYQSQYLSSLFAQKENFVENKESQSTIDLTEKAADAFPILLDFIYSRGTVCNISTETVSDVLYLADYFGTPTLRQKAEDFAKEDLSIQNAPLYYTNAFCLHQDTLIHHVEQLLASNIMEIQPDDEILNILTVESMLEIITSESHLESTIVVPGMTGYLPPPENPAYKFEMGNTLRTKQKTSCHLSKLVCAFIEKHDISEEEYNLLTQEECLPVVDSTVAMKLIELEEMTCGVEMETEKSLKKRCYQKLQEQLNAVDFEDSENEILEFLRRRPSAFAVDILVNHIKEKEAIVKEKKRKRETRKQRKRE